MAERLALDYPFRYTRVMRVYLESLGCRLNHAEMFALGRQLADAGHSLSPTAEDADICVLNSCAVTGEAARKSGQLLRQMAGEDASPRLVVTGCYATLEGERLAALPGVALVVGNSRKDALARIIEELCPFERPPAAQTPWMSALPAQGRTRAFVKVQDGCRNRCTFCVVTLARGDERSRSIADIVVEVRRLVMDGYQEVILTGVHLGGYGHERGAGLATLVTSILSDTDIPRLRLSSLEPFDLAPDFFSLWEQGEGSTPTGGRLMPHLHLPAQSGSDAVLKRMARRNTVAGFEALVAEARVRIPGVTITTDMIVGFPGETEADFEESMAFVRRVGFAHIHVFPYSARVGTAAARFAGQLPEAERRRRSRLMNELDGALGAAVRRSFVGQTHRVLYESRAASEHTGAVCDEAPGVLWSGLTDNYLRVRTALPAGLDARNRILPTRLVEVSGGDLIGEVRCDEWNTGAPI